GLPCRAQEPTGHARPALRHRAVLLPLRPPLRGAGDRTARRQQVRHREGGTAHADARVPRPLARGRRQLERPPVRALGRLRHGDGDPVPVDAEAAEARAAADEEGLTSSVRARNAEGAATMRAARTFLLPCLAACHRDEPKDYGRAPAADHQETVRATMDGVLDQRYRLQEPSEYRFAPPAQDRVGRWLFDGDAEGG